jgi:glucan phosphoethanolaminetransferase (alkaline phosphatase superfamily)
MSLISIASWGFLFGACGQIWCYWALFPHLPRWLVALIAFVPWLTVFAISLFERPLLGPRPFRCCLIFAMSWYAGITLLAEALYLFLAPAHLSLGVARVFMYLFGIVCSIVFVRSCITLHRYEIGSAAQQAVGADSPVSDL